MFLLNEEARGEELGNNTLAIGAWGVEAPITMTGAYVVKGLWTGELVRVQ